MTTIIIVGCVMFYAGLLVGCLLAAARRGDSAMRAAIAGRRADG